MTSTANNVSSALWYHYYYYYWTTSLGVKGDRQYITQRQNARVEKAD